MSDLISRKRLLAEYDRVHIGPPGSARALMEKAPTVDAEPVVRCKDCKHLVLTEEGDHNPNDCVCDYWMTDGLKDDDFCSNGERREND